MVCWEPVRIRISHNIFSKSNYAILRFESSAEEVIPLLVQIVRTGLRSPWNRWGTPYLLLKRVGFIPRRPLWGRQYLNQRTITGYTNCEASVSGSNRTENTTFKDRIELHRFNAFPVSDNHERRGGANSANASKTTREPQNKAHATSEISRILLLMLTTDCRTYHIHEKFNT